MIKVFLFLSLFGLLVSEVQAQKVFETKVDLSRRGSSFSLFFNQKMEKIINKLSEWEDLASSKGRDIQFLTGAGELRRALLHLDIDGPGDVEIFVHFNDREFKKKSIHAVHNELKELGVDLEKEIKDVFGDEKKLDLFIKDQADLKHQRSYWGEFGYFGKMGDNTINHLFYHPKENLILGPKESLTDLTKKEVKYLEDLSEHRVETPKVNKILGKELEYKSTFLRQGLRNIRFYLDLSLSPNPNGFQLDESFDLPIRAFEVFFDGVSGDRLKDYPISEVYQGLFLKFFRNRTPEELKKIQKLFKEEPLGQSYEVMKNLGLDIDFLLEADWGDPSSQKKIEFRGVVQNAEYKHIHDLYDAKNLKIKNPFKSKKILLENIRENVSLRGLKKEDVVPISQDLLKYISSKLYSKVVLFDKLSLLEQSKLLKEYHALCKVFLGTVKSRLKGITFLRKYYSKIAKLVDSVKSDSDGEKPLLHFINENKKKFGSDLSLNDKGIKALNSSFDEFISSEISRVKSKGKKGIIYVDLDQTLFDITGRFMKMMQDFDQSNGTKYFARVKSPNHTQTGFIEFIYETVMGSNPSIKKLRDAEKAEEFYKRNTFNNQRYFQYDYVNEELLQRIKKWRGEGAEVKFLTNRPDYEYDESYRLLKELDLVSSKDDLITRPSGEKTNEFKYDYIKKIQENKKLEVITLIDDNPNNLKPIREDLLPNVFFARAWSDGKGRVRSAFYRKEFDLYAVFHGPGAACINHLTK